ncbi:unnamed protein product [Caenorhabditis brenneri]
MKFLILFCIFAAVAAMWKPIGRPKRPIVRGPVTLDPRKFEGKVWQFINDVNDKDDGRNVLIPVKVISAVKPKGVGWDEILEIIFGETNCAKIDTVDLMEFARDCKLLPNGKRSVWSVYSWLVNNYRPIQTVSKVRDVQPDDVSTSTQSTNRGYTVSDNTEPTNGERNARDLKNVYE